MEKPRLEDIKKDIKQTYEMALNLPRMFYLKCFAAAFTLCTIIYIIALTLTSPTLSLIRRDDAPTSCECPALDGTTELIQLEKYWRDNIKLEEGQQPPTTFTDLAELVKTQGLYKEPKKVDRNIEPYTHIFSQADYQVNVDGLLVAKVVVTELYGRDLTDGGSTFKIITRGRHTQASCAYRDYFNGTYLACCVLREENNDIDFYLMNVRFRTYHMDPSHHKFLSTVRARSTRPAIYPDGDLVLHQPMSLNEIEEKTMYWDHREENHLHPDLVECLTDNEFWVNTALHGWRYVDHGRLTHPMSGKEINKCLNRRYNGAMTVVGDSHMRYVFYYLNSGIRGIGNQLELKTEANNEEALVKGANATYQKITFRDVFIKHIKKLMEENPAIHLQPEVRDDDNLRGKFSNAIIHLPSEWEENKLWSELEEEELDENDDEDYVVELDPQPLTYDDQQKKKELLMLSSGTWDVAYNNSATYITDFHETFEVLEKLMATGEYEVYWQSIPTWPHRLEHSGQCDVNSFIIAAVNAYVRKHLESIGIHYIDMWKIALPFEDTPIACGWNYLCQAKGTYYGHVGKESAQTLIRRACG